MWRWHVDGVTQSSLGARDQVMRLMFHRTLVTFHKFTIIYQPVHLERGVLFEPQFVFSGINGLKNVSTIH